MSSLPGGGDPGDLGGVDQMGMVVLADVDLYHVQPPVEPARACVAGADRPPVVVSHVRGLVRGEDHRLGLFHPAAADGATVVVQGDVAALRQTTAVIGEFDAYL